MARPGILYSDVACAAAKLAAAGTNPTVDGVREALGGTGSKSTIAPLLKRWKAEQQETMVAAEAGLPAPLLQAVKGLHEHMQSEFAQRLEQARQAHDAALRAAAEREEALHAEHQVLTTAHATLSKELGQTQATLAQLQATHHDQGIRLATVEAENAGLQQRLTDRAGEVDMYNRQLSQTRIQFEHYQEATAMQRAEERQGYEQRIARLEQDLTGVQRHVAAQQATIGQQEATISHLTAERERHDQALRAAQEELAAASSARDRLAGRFEDETAAKKRAEIRLDTLQQQLADIHAELAGKMRETEMLGEQLRCAEGRADQLAEEKLTWLRERGALDQRAQAAEQKIAALGGRPTAL